MKRLPAYSLILLLAACSSSSPPPPPPKIDGVFGGWQVMTASPDKREMLCYAVSAPVSSEGTIGAHRGTAYLMATRRESGKIEISAAAGYSFMAGSKTELVVGDDTYRLFFKDSVAWSHDDYEDKDIIDAMEEDPDNIEMHGLSQSGLTSVDHYPTQGFEEAIERIRELCP